MPTGARDSLPDRPDLGQLRRRARELQRAVRAGDADAVALAHDHGAPVDDASRFPLASAQLVLARHYGHASWPRLVGFVEMVNRYTRLPDQVLALDDPADEFLRRACLRYANDDPADWAAARALLAAHPDLAHASIHHAAAVADADAVRAFLARDRSLARRTGGPFRWEPLFVLAYSRVDLHVDERAVVETARLLLQHGADPNAGYLWHGLRTPFTVLTGVFGEGELGPVRQPRHPHSRALARVVLDAGADPNDGQTLYNRMFEPDDSHLELLFEYGLGTGDGGPWKARLGDDLDSPHEMVQQQLAWAVRHGMNARVELIVDHGGDIFSPLAGGRTGCEVAAAEGNTALVELLVARGAPRPELDPVDALLGAALAGDRARVDRLRASDADLVDAARRRRPALLVWAAARRNSGGVALLADLGFDVNAFGRGDTGTDEPWETALHCAVANDDRETVDLLLARGADPDARDARFGATPSGWARYFGHTDLMARLAPLTSEAAGDR
jgi:ankyrin repeat protein